MTHKEQKRMTLDAVHRCLAAKMLSEAIKHGMYIYEGNYESFLYNFSLTEKIKRILLWKWIDFKFRFPKTRKAYWRYRNWRLNYTNRDDFFIRDYCLDNKWKEPPQIIRPRKSPKP